jgi:hypothetical protein
LEIAMRKVVVLALLGTLGLMLAGCHGHASGTIDENQASSQITGM